MVQQDVLTADMHTGVGATSDATYAAMGALVLFGLHSNAPPSAATVSSCQPPGLVGTHAMPTTATLQDVCHSGVLRGGHPPDDSHAIHCCSQPLDTTTSSTGTSMVSLASQCNQPLDTTTSSPGTSTVSPVITAANHLTHQRAAPVHQRCHPSSLQLGNIITHITPPTDG